MQKIFKILKANVDSYSKIEQILHLPETTHDTQVRFALFCAKEAQKYVEKPKPESLKAIETVERFLLGKATAEECKAAAAAATPFAASYAAYATPTTPSGTSAAASYNATNAASNKAAEQTKQLNYLISLVVTVPMGKVLYG